MGTLIWYKEENYARFIDFSFKYSWKSCEFCSEFYAEHTGEHLKFLIVKMQCHRSRAKITMCSLWSYYQPLSGLLCQTCGCVVKLSRPLAPQALKLSLLR